MEIGRQSRAELYNLEQDREPALAPWELRFGLPERVDYTGAILEDLQPDAVDALMALIADSGADAVAVSFLFSFLNPAHENMVYAALQKLRPAPFISLSSRVLPEFREYERASTVVVNAYVGPVMSRYSGRTGAVAGRRTAGNAVVRGQHHGAAGRGTAGADDTERPGRGRGRGLSCGGAGRLSRHYYAGYGRHFNRCFVMPGADQGNGQLQCGRASDQCADD